jgi:hypothetical protein
MPTSVARSATHGPRLSISSSRHANIDLTGPLEQARLDLW